MSLHNYVSPHLLFNCFYQICMLQLMMFLHKPIIYKSFATQAALGRLHNMFWNQTPFSFMSQCHMQLRGAAPCENFCHFLWMRSCRLMVLLLSLLCCGWYFSWNHCWSLCSSKKRCSLFFRYSFWRKIQVNACAIVRETPWSGCVSCLILFFCRGIIGDNKQGMHERIRQRRVQAFKITTPQQLPQFLQCFVDWSKLLSTYTSLFATWCKYLHTCPHLTAEAMSAYCKTSALCAWVLHSVSVRVYQSRFLAEACEIQSSVTHFDLQRHPPFRVVKNKQNFNSFN